MNREQLMIAFSVIDILIAIVGLLLTFGFIILGLVKKDNKRLKKGALIFVSTWVLLFVLRVIEFLIVAA